jgi:hypothetical protein
MRSGVRTVTWRALFVLTTMSIGWGAGLAGASRAQTPPQGQPPQPAASGAESELAVLREEVARLKRLVPSQSHAMQDVSYHYTNLWFAGSRANWPLAQFYLNETRSHIAWAVRIIPKRKISTGEVDLEGIREAFESGYLTGVQQAIDAKSAGRFADAYKFSLGGCYSCHKASEKPFLRPQVPTRSEAQIVNFDPDAKWPE